MFGRGSYAIVRRCKSSIFFVAIRSAMEVSASSQTHWCSLEVPLDAARLANGAPRKGQKREKMGGGDGVTGNGAPFPAAHLFPSPHPAAHVIPLPTPGGGRNPQRRPCGSAR